MSYPASLVTRQVTFGNAVVMESGTALNMQVKVKASRSLVHRPSGTPLISVQTLFVSALDGSGTLALPVCDSPDMGLGNGTQIVLSGTQVTHTYTADIEYFDPTTNKSVGRVTRGPFVVLSSTAGTVDLDDLLVDGSLAGSGVPSVLLQAQQYVTQAQQSASDAQNSAALADATLVEAKSARDDVVQAMQTPTFGIDANGDPYYDPDGVIASEVAHPEIVDGSVVLVQNGQSVPLLDVATGNATYVPANPTLSVTYNPDGTVASTTENGVTTTFTYNADGTVATQTRAGVTKTFTYSNGNVTGAA